MGGRAALEEEEEEGDEVTTVRRFGGQARELYQQ